MRQRTIAVLLALAVAVSACAYHDSYGYGPHAYEDYGYDGDDYARGEALLDPWLAETEEGRAILARGFRAGPNGRISDEMADRANIWFRRYADHDRDMRLTDEEIRVALAHAAWESEPIGY